jgi:hypothetical protein
MADFVRRAVPRHSAICLRTAISMASPKFVEMKRKAQEKIYQETKDLSRDELVAYFRRQVETGPFAQVWKGRKRTRATARGPGKSRR